MASDEPILSAEAAKVMRCLQFNEPLDVLAPGIRCRSKVRQQFACGKCASIDSRLRRLLITWPLDEMKDCAEQDTFDFYRRAAAAVGPPLNSGLLCRCHACGIAVCFAAGLCIVYSGLLYRCHARRVAACPAVVMRAEWRLIPRHVRGVLCVIV